MTKAGKLSYLLLNRWGVIVADTPGRGTLPVNQVGLEARVKTVLGKPDTVLLIGSGLSLWSGLPTWKGLLEELAAFLSARGRNVDNVLSELQGGDLLLAASYATHSLPPRDLGTFLRARLSNATPSACHEVLVRLGPSCFITTNYDTLLEDALGYGNERPTIVHNKQVAEMAEIIPAASRNFIYKYHGDISDASSIILSRAQYRRIQHENPAASKAFSFLLATRPVVMIGFGLRDPDYLYLQDDLLGTFQGQAGEYYAILPDQNDEHIRYWREEHHIDVLTYATSKRADGTSDHSELLRLLERLQTRAVAQDVCAEQPPDTLLLARLGAAMSRLRPESADLLLPLTITRSDNDPWDGNFYGGLLVDFFSRAPRVQVITGSPGAGKTFSIRQRVADVADALTKACLLGDSIEDISVPVYVNLNLYSGNISQLIQGVLPQGLDLHDLLRTCDCHIFLDAANEAPRSYIEDNTLLQDIQTFCEDNDQVRISICSRTESWIDGLKYPRYNIESIDEDFVIEHFSDSEWTSAISNPEILSILQRPLLFSLARQKHIDPKCINIPTDIYHALFSRASMAISTEANIDLDLAASLSATAHGMLRDGKEVAPREVVENALATAGKSASGILDLMIKQDIIHPLSGGLFSFFHQSATEYLAAIHIASRYEDDSSVVKLYLEDRRWDQALFLLFGILPSESKSKFFDTILNIDVTAAARAAFYADLRDDEFTRKLMNKVFDIGNIEFEQGSWLSFLMDGLPISASLTVELLKLSTVSGAIGGWALAKLGQVTPTKQFFCIDYTIKQSNKDDYNYTSSFVRSSEEWLPHHRDTILKLARENKDIDSLHPFGNVENLLDGISLESLKEISQGETAASTIVAGAMSKSKRLDAIPFLKWLAITNPNSSLYPLYHKIHRNSSDVELKEFLPYEQILMDKLIESLSGENGLWVEKIILELSKHDPTWGTTFLSQAETTDEVGAAIIRFLFEGPGVKQVNFREILRLSEKFTTDQRHTVYSADWWDDMPVDMVISAISETDLVTNEAILQSMQGRISQIELIDARPLSFWIEVLSNREDDINCFHDLFMITRFLIRGGHRTRDQLMEFLSQSDDTVLNRIIPSMAVFSMFLDDGKGNFPKNVIVFVLNNIERPGFANFLGSIVDEQTVEQELVPLVMGERSPFIQKALRRAGRRHNRRYALVS